MADSTVTLSPAGGPYAQSSAPDVTGVFLTSSTSGRYVLLNELARGGMGVVFAASDLALGRNVAVKVLHKGYQNHPEVARRFLEEARITGQLQHPGVPPVHDLGTLTDGRPFLAMKLVEGRTLAQLLADRPDPPHDLPQFLPVFEQVCQTVAFAHSRGFIHRDLKPSNVMVGAFGEVQVMDWGVAKVLTERAAPPADGSTEHGPGPTVESMPDPDSVTRPGSVVGTPEYMPPEQAQGDVDVTDARADVFSLGGMLCELLTNCPPFVGPRPAVRALARAGDLDPAFARLDACGADRELVALAKWCLSPVPADRPSDAGVVTASVAAYRAGVEHRLRRAELERAESAVRDAEWRKRRRAHQALAAVGVLALLAGGAAAWWEDRRAAERRAEKQREEVRAGEAIAAGLGEVETALRADDLAAADAAIVRVRQKLDSRSPAPLRHQLDDLVRDRDMVAALDFFTDAQRTSPSAGVQPPRLTDAQDYTEVFRRYGLDLRAGDPAAMAERISLAPIRAQLLDGLDAALGHYGFSAAEIPPLLPEVLRRLDPVPARNRIRDAVFARDSLRLLALVRDLDPAYLTPGFAVLLVGQQFGLPPAERLRVLKAAYAGRPDNFRLNQLLCLLYLDSGRDAAGTPPDRAAAATTHASILVSLRPWSPTGYRLLASARKRAGQLDEAIAALKKAVELTAAPDRAGVLKYQIGALIAQRSGPDAALGYFRDQVGQAPDDAYAYWNLGRVLRERGDPGAALVHLRRAIELQPAEGAFYPDAAQVLRQLGELDEAARTYRLAAEHARPLRWSHVHGLGPVLVLQGKYREAVRVQERLMAEFPEAARAVNTLVRYNAACAAAQAGTAGGADPLPPDEWPAARRKALGWLRDDLTVSRTELALEPRRSRAEVNARMRKWLADLQLAAVREPSSLDALPPDEARDWLVFWDEVCRLRDDSEPAVAPPPHEAKRQ